MGVAQDLVGVPGLVAATATGAVETRPPLFAAADGAVELAGSDGGVGAVEKGERWASERWERWARGLGRRRGRPGLAGRQQGGAGGRAAWGEAGAAAREAEREGRRRKCERESEVRLRPSGVISIYYSSWAP